MDLKAAFLESLVSAPKLSSGHKPEEFLGHIYEKEKENIVSPLLGVLAGGKITAVSPYSFDIRSLDCFLLLHTKKGCGKLLINGHVHTLMEDSLLFFDCHQRFRLDIAIEPWEYRILFITGKSLPEYYAMLPAGRTALMPLSASSETAFCLEKLLTPNRTGTLSDCLYVSSLLNTIITGCIICQLSDTAASYVAPYLTEMKDLFDNHFQENFSLDDLEKQFHVSKYKLCREFGDAFDAPPLQYLNRKRIENAKHLLLTTSLKVHEIGSQVGIDNTNHFISLFKKFTGVTPLAFKMNGQIL